MVDFKKSVFCFEVVLVAKSPLAHVGKTLGCRLSSETVKGAALSLKGIDYIKSSDGLSASVLSVGDGITDDVLKEDLKNSSGLLVDKA